MEIGDYSTNVLSSDRFAIVHYVYYAFSPHAPVGAHTLIQTEQAWRREGSLAIRDARKEGIFVFGTESTIESCPNIRKTSIEENSEVFYTEQGRGSYQPSLLFKDLKAQENAGASLHSDSKVSQAQTQKTRPLSNTSNSGNETDIHSPNLTSTTYHELFLAAIIESLMLKICETGSYLPLNARTLVLRRSAMETMQGSYFSINDELSLITIDVQMTAQTTLILRTSLRRTTGLGCLGKGLVAPAVLPPHSYVYLAPIDVMAQLSNPVTNDDNKFKDTEWRVMCQAWFQSRGIREDVQEKWIWLDVDVVLPAIIPAPNDDVCSIQWPAPLCFFHRQKGTVVRNAPDDLTDYDVLEFVEHWYKTQTERDAIISCRAKERDIANATALHSIRKSHMSGPSLRRSSVAGNIYPTPPDGVQQAIAATPTFDDSGLTPSVSQIMPSAELHAGTIASVDPEAAEGSIWSGPSPEQESGDVASDMQSQPQQTSDNLFGEIDGDLFGDEHDVTDADFSFFDAPGLAGATSEGPVKHKISESTAHLQAEVQSTDANATQTPKVIDVVPAKQESDLKFVDTIPEIDIFTNEIIQAPPTSITPPLDPETVFKKLSSLTYGNGKLKKLNTSMYEGVNFNPKLPSFASKYGDRGRFLSPITPQRLVRTPSSALPETDYMHKRQKRKSVISKCGSPATNTATISCGLILARSSSVSSDADSDDSTKDVPSQEEDDGQDISVQSPLTPRRKRKRSPIEDLPLEAVYDTPTVVHMEEGHSDQRIALLSSDPAGWSLTRYFRQPKSCARVLPFDDVEYVAIAQILAEQAMSSVFEISDHPTYDATYQSLSEQETGQLRRVHHDVMQRAQSLFAHITPCNLSSYIEISDGSNVGQQRPPARPIQSTRMGVAIEPPRSIFTINAPPLEVSRARSKLSVIPSAISFWRNLGLGPVRGPKNVSAVCIHPRARGLLPRVHDFLLHTASAYESGRFGTHSSFEHAEFAYDLTPSSSLNPSSLHTLTAASSYPSLQEINMKLGTALTGSLLQHKNFVIYYVYDPATPDVLVHICSAFHNLSELYRASFIASRTSMVNKLVLQLVPISFIASVDTFVTSTPSRYTNLALEVYDRCVDLKSGDSIPAIVIERPPFRMVDFNLSPEPSASVLQENSVMHIAYASTVDDRWMTAAWSDSYGTSQATASYCRSRDGQTQSSATDLATIAAEIWDTTVEIVSSRKVKWRIMLAKCGIMESEELDMWKALISNTGGMNLNVTIIGLDSRPSLQFIPPPTSISPTALGAGSMPLATPVGTPPTGTVSPEQTTNTVSTPIDTPGYLPTSVMTPVAESNNTQPGPDSALVDVREQSWGVILAHRLNNTNSLLDVNPSLVSGYLLKRGGTSIADAPVCMEVNILYSDTRSRLHEVLLRETLYIYRCLGTLARVRGRTGHGDIRPWHIAAAEKGVEVLGCLL